MSSFRLYLKRSGLPVLLVLCLAALSVSYASADEANRPRALVILGDPDAAVNGRFAVGTSSVGSKMLTVVGVIDFLGSGTVHNYFTQGSGNNMQINTNVDETNVVGDPTRSQWKLVLGSNLDWFSIRRSPAGAAYDEDALFFIEGSTGNVGIATVDTNNQAPIAFTPQARLDVRATSGNAIWGQTAATSGSAVLGLADAASGTTYGVLGENSSTEGTGVYGYASAGIGTTFGVYGWAFSATGYGVFSYGDMRAIGDLSATGTKSAIVETQTYGWRHLYAMESPQNWFEDFGKATLVAGGAVITVEPIFAQTVNLSEDYHVFLTPRGDCGLYVAEQTASTFTVRALDGATCEIPFDYRIIAPRLDYEGLRLEAAEDPESVAASLPMLE